MMTCKDYIFKLTSGQVHDAGRFERLLALQHRLMCSRCRAFTKNDERVSEILDRYREQLLKPDTGGRDAAG